MSDDNSVENKKNAKNNFTTNLGNVNGFFNAIGVGLGHLLISIIIGGSILQTLATEENLDLDEHYPTNIEEKPFCFKLIHDKSSNSMSGGCPTNDNTWRHVKSGHDRNNITNAKDFIIAWFIETWFKTIARVNDWLKSIFKGCQYLSGNTIGSLLNFYVIPHILFIMIIPFGFIGSITTFITSIFTNDDWGVITTFSLFTYFIFGFMLLITKKFMAGIGIMMAGFLLWIFQLIFYGVVGSICALKVLYNIYSPITSISEPWNRIKSTISSFKLSLMIYISLVIFIPSAFTYLNTEIAWGMVITFVYLMYKIYKS